MSSQGEAAGHVFISYVREDSHRVDQLQRTLQAVGIPVWRDTADLWPGQDWRAKIREAITDNALVFIACFSRASLARLRSYQNEELTLAIEQLRLRRPDDPWLLPVRFDECDIPDRDIGAGRTLTSIQRADLYGDSYHNNIDRLAITVLRILGRHSGAGKVEIREQQPVEGWEHARPRFTEASDQLGHTNNALDGEPPLREQDVQQVCDILREALDQAGDYWGRFRVQPEISDVDAMAEDGYGGRLQVQVTRVEHGAWREVARTGRAESVETDERRAAAIWDAITKKSTRIPPRQRAQLVLVLDAIRTPGYLRSAVIEVFRAHYGEQASNLGYIAIWLVGPTAALTHQLP